MHIEMGWDWEWNWMERFYLEWECMGKFAN